MQAWSQHAFFEVYEVRQPKWQLSMRRDGHSGLVLVITQVHDTKVRRQITHKGNACVGWAGHPANKEKNNNKNPTFVTTGPVVLAAHHAGNWTLVVGQSFQTLF
jgi:hypothetical protein